MCSKQIEERRLNELPQRSYYIFANLEVIVCACLHACVCGCEIHITTQVAFILQRALARL